jgi:hypothetical protein
VVLKSFFVLYWFGVFSSFSFGQIRWKAVQPDSLPSSIKVFRTNDSLNGRPFIAYYVEANLKDKNLEFTTQVGKGQRFTPDQYYAQEGQPYIVVNGTFFSFQTNQNLNVTIRDGQVTSYNVPALKSRTSDSFYYPTRSAIGITKNRRADVAWLFTDTAVKWP